MIVVLLISALLWQYGVMGWMESGAYPYDAKNEYDDELIANLKSKEKDVVNLSEEENEDDGSNILAELMPTRHRTRLESGLLPRETERNRNRLAHWRDKKSEEIQNNLEDGEIERSASLESRMLPKEPAKFNYRIPHRKDLLEEDEDELVKKSLARLNLRSTNKYESGLLPKDSAKFSYGISRKMDKNDYETHPVKRSLAVRSLRPNYKRRYRRPRFSPKPYNKYDKQNEITGKIKRKSKYERANPGIIESKTRALLNNLDKTTREKKRNIKTRTNPEGNSEARNRLYFQNYKPKRKETEWGENESRKGKQRRNRRRRRFGNGRELGSGSERELGSGGRDYEPEPGREREYELGFRNRRERELGFRDWRERELELEREPGPRLGRGYGRELGFDRETKFGLGLEHRKRRYVEIDSHSDPCHDEYNQPHITQYYSY